MKQQTFNTLIYYLYPLISAIFAVLVLWWLFWPGPAKAGVVVENHNDSQLINSVKAESSSTNGQNSAQVRIYTEINGQVVSDEEYQNEEAEEALIKVRQNITASNSIQEVTTKVEINAGIEAAQTFEVSDESRESRDNTSALKEKTQIEPELEIMPVARSQVNASAEVGTGGVKAEASGIEEGVKADEKKDKAEASDQTLVQVSWWLRWWQGLKDWWDSLFLYFA